jgi:hypothetical protein
MYCILANITSITPTTHRHRRLSYVHLQHTRTAHSRKLPLHYAYNTLPSHCRTLSLLATASHSLSLPLPHRRWVTFSSTPTQRLLLVLSCYTLCALQPPLMGDRGLQGRRGREGRRMMQGKSEEYAPSRWVSVLSLSQQMLCAVCVI